jgi:hypothetical protein
MNNKEQYRKFCAANAVVPVFANPLWLDAVAEEWNVCLISESDNESESNKIIAALPYCLKGNLLTKRIYLPDLNFYQSIIFFKELKKNEKQKICEALLKQLPLTIKSYFKFLPEHSSIELSKLNFQKEAYTTYVLTDEKAILLSNNHKRNLQKGIKHNFQIKESKNLEASFALLTSTFSRQNINPKITIDAFKQLNAVCKKHKLGRTLDCYDANKNLTASVFIAEDQQTVFYLFGGYDIQFKNSGAMTFLLHQIIQNALLKGLLFNFCGSSKKSIAAYFEGFGAQKTPINIWKKTII